jgi:hypothetical protein
VTRPRGGISYPWIRLQSGRTRGRENRPELTAVPSRAEPSNRDGDAPWNPAFHVTRRQRIELEHHVLDIVVGPFAASEQCDMENHAIFPHFYREPQYIRPDEAEGSAHRLLDDVAIPLKFGRVGVRIPSCSREGVGGGHAPSSQPGCGRE